MRQWPKILRAVMWNRRYGYEADGGPDRHGVGADMIIANAQDVGILHDIMEGDFRGTFFKAQKNSEFDIQAYLNSH